MTVLIDQISESRAVRTAEGVEIERIALVTGLTGSAAGKTVRALSAPGLPNFGEPHPEHPASTLQEIQAQPQGNEGTMSVRMVYRPGQDVQGDVSSINEPDFVTSIELSSSLETEITNEDINGDLMVVRYGGFPGRVDQVFGRLVLLSEVVQVEYARPSLQVRFRVNHQSIPKRQAVEFIGSVNGSEWSGFAPETWLLTDVDTIRDQGLWRTSYRMLYRPETWQVNFAIKFQGATPLDIAPGNGQEMFQLYPLRNWNELGVAF